MNPLTDLWKATALHPRLQDQLEALQGILGVELGCELILAYRLDPQAKQLELIGMAGTRSRAAARIPLTEVQLVEATLACRSAAGFPAGLLPREAQTIAIPGGETCGWVVALKLSAGSPLNRTWEVRLREILGAGLRTSAMLHRLETEREAAEFNSATLLRKLGRESPEQTVIGSSTGLRSVMERVAMVAPTDLPVLLLGETGSGKEVVARSLHDGSQRRHAAFVRVNCGALSPGLIDSELFGHEKGSFTGADSARKGWFERADGGTLFLDEIGEMPESVQARLLRVLQDGTFERVGGETPRHANIRVIAATHRDLGAMVKEGRFRHDLWFRIATFPIAIPPLRERPEDIPDLARHFAERAARRFGIRPIALSPEDLDLLLEYSWPGNIRELAAVIDRGVLLGQGSRVDVAPAIGFNPLVRGGATPAPFAASLPSPVRDPRPEGNSHLDSVVREHIEKELRRALGRVEGPFGAAAALGINPHTLRSRMRKLGIEPARFRRARG